MRLESLEPKTESEFYACVRRLTGGRVFYERVEPSNESGFPDVYFVVREEYGEKTPEGTIELKHADTALPNLRSLARGTQKAALLEYFAAGGRRRFALCYCKGTVFFWNTTAFAKSILGGGRGWTSSRELSCPNFAGWLEDMIK